MKKAEKLQSTDETAVTYEPMLGNVISSKEEAVTTYLKEIGIAIQVLLQQQVKLLNLLEKNDLRFLNLVRIKKFIIISILRLKRL